IREVGPASYPGGLWGPIRWVSAGVASRGRDLASAGPAWSTPRGNGYVQRDNLLLAHCPPQKRRLRSIFQDQLVLPRRHIVQIEGGLLGTEDVVRRHPPTICALEFLRVGGMLDGQGDPLCGREDRDEAIIDDHANCCPGILPL